ncbi:MAG: ABC transporter substrate-binding protein [Gammaproteobacteria bacterium]|nr:ABC transporter substrate-binding protein [Gammaproteobacteria bacterium]
MNLNIKTFLIIVSIGLLLSACDDLPVSPMRVGTNTWIGYQPLYLAKDLDYLNMETIRLVQYPSASEVLRAFRNQTLEAASLTLDEVLQLRQLDIPVAVILIHDFSNGADAIISHSDVKSVKQLKGKVVGVESGALGAYLITRALELNNMKIGDIVVKNIDFNFHEKTFQNKEVDAVVTFDPVRARLLSYGGNQIFDSTMMPGEIVDVLVVHQEYIDRHPDVIKKLIDGWFRAVDYMVNNPADTYLKLSRRLHISQQEVETGIKQIVFPDRNKNNQLLGGNNPQLFTTVQRLNKVLIANKLLHLEITDKDLLTNEFLKDSE